MQKQLLLTLLTAATLFMAGCGGTEDSRAVPVQVPTNPGGAPVTGVLTALYDPTTGVVPTPNNLVYSGSADGTLNLPVADANDFGDPLVAINAQDGWSTVAPMSTAFSATVNPTTVQPGVTVRIFNVNLSGPGGAVIAVNSELQAGVDFVALISPSDPTSRTLVILPLRPLPEKSHFAVVLTNGITDTVGNAATPSQIYHIAKRTSPLVANGASTDPLLALATASALEPLRQLTNAREIAVSAFASIPRANMVLSWTVSTQSVTDVIDYVAANAASADNFFVPTGTTTPGGLANVFVGYIDLPYGLQAPDDLGPADPTRILSGFWQGAGGSNLTRFNPAVVWRSTQRVPAVLTVPVAAPPPAGYPVAIFQHGITGHRGQAFGMADAAANAGFAVISIDQPLHGIAAGDATFGSLHASVLNATGIPGFDTITERTFNVDLVNNTTGAPGPDGNVDGSGTHTINLASLLTARDNLRQASADLLTVAATVGDFFTYNPMAMAPMGIPFDDSRIHFVGHSLGAIVGTATVGAAGGDISVATLGMPGGGIARLLDGSPTFAPRIRAGLAAAGVAYPSADYDAFMFAAQTVVDSADPINHAARASANAAIHMIAVVGDGGANLPDQVVPNSVAGAPTSGTLPLAAAMGLANVSTTTIDGSGVRGLVRFTEGDHGSLLSPTASAAAFTEMATQMATFLGSTGTVLQITNTAVIQP